MARTTRRFTAEMAGVVEVVQQQLEEKCTLYIHFCSIRTTHKWLTETQTAQSWLTETQTAQTRSTETNTAQTWATTRNTFSD
jgi:hypothetical protein